MYEPYGEEKKFNFKEKLNQVKQKIQESTKNIKFDKISIVAIAFGLLLTVGSITSYVSYTGRFNTMKSENEILKGQTNALQTKADEASQQLSTCSLNLESSKADLEITRGQLTKVSLDYQTASTNLQTCSDEKLTLASDLNQVNNQLKQKQEDYNTLEDKFNDLESDLEKIECNFAKQSCTNMKYYFMKDSKVFCCLKKDPEFCAENPGSIEIKEITC